MKSCCLRVCVLACVVGCAQLGDGDTEAGSDTIAALRGCGALASGEALYPGQAALSCGGKLAFVHQTDGNVVLYYSGRALWSSGTNGRTTSVLLMQGDGNLVLYGPGYVPIWSTGTWRYAGASLAIQGDCNAVIYAGGSAVWATNTSGCPWIDDPTQPNAMVLDTGAVVPTYPIASDGPARAVGYVNAGSAITAYDQDQHTLWTTPIDGAAIFGGFDYDRDGWPDVGYVISTPSGSVCGQTAMLDTSLAFVAGGSGAINRSVAPLAAKCWSFPPTPDYPTTQWTAEGVLFGASSGLLTLLPYYATAGYYFSYAGGGFSSNAFYFPSTASYDATYPNAKPNAWSTSTDYLANSHVGNGLVVDDGQRLVFFTSGRVVQYRVGPLDAAQLLTDHPFVTAGRTDLAGRNYGLVAVDPNFSSHVALLAGTDAFTVFTDLANGTITSDVWGGIERHVSVYDYVTDGLDDRFYSYALDGGSAYQYEGRVVYPAHPFIRRGAGQPSRLAYSVYSGGHWYVHISKPGVTADRYALRDVFLWDIADMNGDGIEELIISPTRWASDPDVPGYYFPKWQTSFYHWNESTLTLGATATFANVVPYLVPTFNQPTRRTSRAYLYPALSIAKNGTRSFLGFNASKQVMQLPLQ